MKTLRINEETHKMIINKIEELKTRYGISITIESLVDSVLKNGLSKYNIVEPMESLSLINLSTEEKYSMYSDIISNYGLSEMLIRQISDESVEIYYPLSSYKCIAYKWITDLVSIIEYLKENFPFEYRKIVERLKEMKDEEYTKEQTRELNE